MKNILLRVMAMSLIASHSVFADLEINDTLIGDFSAGKSIEALKAAKESHTNTCNSWSEQSSLQFGASILYSSCGTRKEESLIGHQEIKFGTECDYDEEGNYRCYPIYTPAHDYIAGYISSSQAILRLKASVDVAHVEESVNGDSSIRSKLIEENIAQGLQLWKEACLNWKSESKVRYGNHFIYAACSGNSAKPKDVGGKGLVQYQSIGKIYLTKK